MRVVNDTPPSRGNRCPSVAGLSAMGVLCCAVLWLLCCAALAGAATAAPEIQEESVTQVSSTAATLRAKIALNGAATSSYFQYSAGDTAACTVATCTNVPKSPGVAIGSSGEVEAPGERVQGLAPATVYHYRVVALSRIEVEPGQTETEEFDGPDRTFTTQWAGAFALPDGRQWEMVSPPEKEGARIASQAERGQGEGNLVQAAAGGGAITYVAYAPTEAAPSGFANGTQVFSVRGLGGWRSWDLNAPHEVASGASSGKGNEYRFFSEDLSLAIVQPFGPFLEASPQEEAEPLSPSDRALAPAEASEQTAFLHTNYLNGDPGERCERPVASCYRPLVTARPGYADVPPGTKFAHEHECPPELCGPVFVGASSDGRHVLLNMHPEPGQQGLYEWSAGTLQFIATGAGAALGAHNEADLRHAVSNDGSRVFYTLENEHLYMHELGHEAPLQLDLPEPGCGGCGTEGGVFQDASSDGSRVFFTDESKLTTDADAGAGHEESNLYECDIVEEKGAPRCLLSDLTPRSSSGKGAAVIGYVPGISEDGAWVYFVANAVLENGGAPIAGAVSGTCRQGENSPAALCNLYVRHDGETHLVAVIDGGDNPDWGRVSPTGGMGNLVARVSPSGRWLSFMSERELTGYDSRDAVSGQPDEEVYLYDASERRLVCASCDPTGARPRGERHQSESTGENNMPTITDVLWNADAWLAASLPGWTPYRLAIADYQSRFLANDGRLFFDSRDALVPQDGNENWDVYEYEPPGVGSCTTSNATFAAGAGGCVGLLSSGTFAGESALLDASSSGGRETEGNEGGGDVFVITAAQLSTRDKDGAFDIYDAHECSTASPCVPPPAEPPPPCVTADACRAAPSPQPGVFGAPASATFSGAGNLSQPLPPAAKPKSVAQIRKEGLANALRACKAKQRRKQRAACEASARKRYGTAHRATKRRRAGKASARRRGR
jgi:hypothetical protein